MNCESVKEQLNAWSDGQLDPDQATAIDSHLATCPGCRAESELLREQDTNLRRAFRPQHAAAQRVAARVVEQLDIDRMLAPSPPRAARRWGSLLLATAAGFLLAVLIFQPWGHGSPVAQHFEISPDIQTQPTLVAQLVVATGVVEIRQPGEQIWQTSAGGPAFSCPAGSDVRTGPHVQCELKTSSGGVVRLNDDTQIKLATGDTIEIECGQIWCSSPDGAAMNVLAPAGASPSVPADFAWAVGCPADACVQTAVGRNGGTQVTTSAGEIDVQTPTARQKLKPGETVSIAHGAIIKDQRASDPLLSARWTQPLLVRKGYDNRELRAYVDQLLSGVGPSQFGLSYEQDIRSLGEYAALPLIRCVQSPVSQDDPAKRQSAMRIVSDIAPGWVLGDLIGLLADRDAETRIIAARTIQRLTGLDQGRQPEAWREDLMHCRPTIDLWLQWWAENQDRYPPPAVGSSSA